MSTKADLSAIARASPSGIITTEEARRALGSPTSAAATRRLAELTRRGWLVRARRGLYVLVPLEATQGNVTPGDPWVLATRLFDPCYVAGWSAAEHWGLTEQIFRATFIATAAAVRQNSVTILGAEYRLARIPKSRLDGVANVWRGSERVAVSSPERTIVDAARDPAWVGGIRHLADIVGEYSRRTSGIENDTALAATLRELGNGAAAKRLGFLLERVWPAARTSLDAATQLKSAGVIKLDPAVRSRGMLAKRWGLWINSAALAAS